MPTNSSAPTAIYRPTRQDIPALAALGAELFIETFGHLYKPADLTEFLNRVHSVAGVTHDWDSGMQYWVALDALDRWIGYVKGGKVGLPVEVGDRRAFELKQLYVRKEHHGHGVADALMHAFLNFAAEGQTQDIYISCWSENPRALRFYARHGFEVVGSYTFWVGNQGDDERILKRSFDAC